MIYFICFILIIAVYLLHRLNKSVTNLHERQKIFEKWMFDSLYSIDNNVVLPETISPVEFKKANVITKNPMNEFIGLVDDRDFD